MTILQFIGSGSAFNTGLGNNSAFYKRDNELLLIDCGSSTFGRLKDSDVLDNVEHIHVLITHTHADHVGSLADLILYSYYSLGEFAKNKITVHHPGNIDQLYMLLQINGCIHSTHYDIKAMKTYDEHVIMGDGDDLITAFSFNTKHVDEIPSYGFELTIGEKFIYYSGDAKDIHPLDIKELKNGGYDEFYIDTCKADYKGNVHLSLNKLAGLIEFNRERVYCMHLDEGFVRSEAEELGFNVVKNYKC